MDISGYIKELILKNQDVIIPGFGGFISEYEPATFDVKENIFLPPAKKIQFKPDYSFPDDTLVNYISGKEIISKDKAAKRLEEFISFIKKENQINISDIGILRKNDKGNLEFIQNEGATFIPEAYGLKSVKTNPITIKTGDKSASQKQPLKKKSQSRIIVLSVSGILFFTFIGLCWYMSNGFTNFDFLSFSKSGNTVQLATDTDALKSEAYLDSISKADSIKACINSSIDVATNKKEALFYTEQRSKTEEPKTAYSKFYIIAGSFKSSKNAQNFCDELVKNGYSPEIIESENTIYRVALNSYTNESSALKELYLLRSNSDIKQVWILKSN